MLFIHCDLSYIAIIKTNWLDHYPLSIKEPLVRYSNIIIMASDREMNDHDNNIMLDYGIYIYMLCMYVICTFKTLCAILYHE